MSEISVDKDLVRQLVDGTISLENSKHLLRMEKKDKGRFHTYIEVLQDNVSWDEKILLRMADHIFVVSKGNGERVVKCTCGHEFGDYRINWKLSSMIRVRETQKDINKVYHPEPAAPEAEWQEVREFFCPSCAAQLAVEVVPPGYPVVFEMLPDIDRFYSEFLGTPLADASPHWYENHSFQRTAEWLGQ